MFFSEFSSKRKDMSSIKWEIKSVNHPFQKDVSNCGIFVCLFLDELLKSEKIKQLESIEFDLKDTASYRNKVKYAIEKCSSKLINLSLSINEIKINLFFQ
jgi:Ulp1 family protease